MKIAISALWNSLERQARVGGHAAIARCWKALFVDIGDSQDWMGFSR